MKYDVGALPSATFGGWVARMCATSVVNFDFYNAEPCPEGCDGFMVAAIYTSSPRAAISVRTGQLQPMVPQTVSQPTLRKSGRADCIRTKAPTKTPECLSVEDQRPWRKKEHS